MKEFLAKGLSGRKIELDEVIEPEQDDQSSATPRKCSGSGNCIHGSRVYNVLKSRHRSSYLTKLVVIKLQDLRTRYY
jgi:hypothetical protein